jgi:hypothetical protein
VAHQLRALREGNRPRDRQQQLARLGVEALEKGLVRAILRRRPTSGRI